jgi:uncharacterized protein (TIRG00374 family)
MNHPSQTNVDEPAGVARAQHVTSATAVRVARSTAPVVTAEPLASELDVPPELSKRKLRRRLLFGGGLVALVVALITLLPGLGEVRSRLANADPGWLGLGVGLKFLSGRGYVAVFRMVFCRRMTWRVSYQIGMSELGANALFPTGGAGGLALGAWALRRGGMSPREIARRSVAFFLLTSIPNVLAVFFIGVGLAVGLLPGEPNLLLTLLPAAAAALAIVGALLAGRLAATLQERYAASRDLSASSRGARVLSGSLQAIANGVDEALSLLQERNALLSIGLVAYLAFDVMMLWTCFRAFGDSPPLAIVWMAYLIGELGGLIPVPGGIGGVDLGLVGALVVYGVSLAPATAAVLAYRAIALWVPAVLGSLAFVALRRTLRDEAQKIAICAPQTEMDVIGIGTVVISEPA